MKIFLDTGNLDEIRWAAASGLIDGVTTSPSRLGAHDSKGDMPSLLADVCRLVNGPVTTDVASVDAEGMYREGRELAKVADNVIIKLPMIEEGIIAIRRLTLDGIRVQTTLIFTAAQALLAAKAGASYVSPSVGSLEDAGHDGLATVRDTRLLFDNYDIECGLLATGVRNPVHFVECGKIGADAVAITAPVLQSLFVHPLTDRGLDQFLSDWSKRIAKSRTGA
ncbi:MAG: transaldolase family protein [Gemmatimonadaceae bacterium]